LQVQRYISISISRILTDTGFTYSILWCKYNGTENRLQKIIFGTCYIEQACESGGGCDSWFFKQNSGYMNEVTTKLTLAYDNIDNRDQTPLLVSLFM